ncbi:hypothetical protein [Alcanivorax sp. 1008]|nr:hypothetical protein [Alcanivorax sp. 1008]
MQHAIAIKPVAEYLITQPVAAGANAEKVPRTLSGMAPSISAAGTR